MQKSGWLVVNGFLRGRKYDELYAFLQTAAQKQGATLSLRYNDELIGEFQELPDFVVFWDKDVPLARRFERAGVRTYNSARTIEICDNKILTAEALHGRVNTPKTLFAPKTFLNVGYTNTDFLRTAAQTLGFPLIIKEAFGSFGREVYLAATLAEAEKIVEQIGGKDFLMQEFIATSRGRDIRVNVVGGQVVSAMLRSNENDFRSNISGGGKAENYVLTAAQAQAAIAASEAVGADFAGVDILFGKDGEPLVCEVNSNPHFKSSYECTGVDVSEYILAHIMNTL